MEPIKPFDLVIPPEIAEATLARLRAQAIIAQAFAIPAYLISADASVSAGRAGQALLVRNARKVIARRRYLRRFHNHAPRMRQERVRTEAQKARAQVRELVEAKRFTQMGIIFRGALDWLRGNKGVKELATPRGQYHSATKKGPGRRPLQPRTFRGAGTDGAKWLMPSFPRGH